MRIESKPFKEPTKKELIAFGKKVHKETVAFLKRKRELERLSELRQKTSPIVFI